MHTSSAHGDESLLGRPRRGCGVVARMSARSRHRHPTGRRSSRATAPAVMTAPPTPARRARRFCVSALPKPFFSALTAGGMRPQGGRLSGAESAAVAEHLSGRPLGGDVTGAAIGRCVAELAAHGDAAPALVAGAAGRRRPTNTRFQSAQQAGLTADAVPRLTLKWAFGFPDATSAWSQPTVGRRPSVRRKPEWAPSTPLDAKTAACGGRSRAKSGVGRAATFGAPASDTHPARKRRHGVLRRHRRQRLRARRRDRTTDLVATRWTSIRMPRVTGTPTLYQDRLYVPVSLARGDGRESGRIRVLHLPRQPDRTRCPHRRRRLAVSSPCRPPQSAGQDRDRRDALWDRQASASGRRRPLMRNARSSTSAPATPTAGPRSRPPTRSSRSISRPAP